MYEDSYKPLFIANSNIKFKVNDNLMTNNTKSANSIIRLLNTLIIAGHS